MYAKRFGRKSRKVEDRSLTAWMSWVRKAKVEGASRGSTVDLQPSTSNCSVDVDLGTARSGTNGGRVRPRGGGGVGVDLDAAGSGTNGGRIRPCRTGGTGGRRRAHVLRFHLHA